MHPTFRTPTRQIVTAGISLIFIYLAWFHPDIAKRVTSRVVLISFIMVGIPLHAADRVWAGEILGLNQTFKGRLLFYGSHLLIIFSTGALWFFHPVSGMILFLALSVYQFGKADMNRFLKPEAGNRPVYYTGRGLLVIGLILFSSPAASFAIAADAMQTSVAGLRNILPEAEWMLAIWVGFYIISLLPGLSGRQIHSPLLLVLDTILLIITIGATGTLLGFALYFACWYSAGRVSGMRPFSETRGRIPSVGGYLLKAVPFTFTTIFGLIALAWFHQAHNLQNEYFSLLLILVTVLIFPQQVILKKMFRGVKSR